MKWSFILGRKWM